MLPLPTDNLYKFIALGGLLVLALSVYYPVRQAMELRRVQVQLIGEVKLLKLQFGGSSPPPDKWQELETKIKLESVAFEEMQLLKAAGISGIILGLMMTISGFTLWYSKIQKYQDRILAKDASSSEASSAESEPLETDKPADVQQ